ncbi:MAG: MlaD family protein [Betaproteobacteria bacterium]|nr:MlaD family protein [Betaproteobacteria bacterium]
MENRAYAFSVGLFVLVLGAALAFSVWWLSGRSEQTYTVVLYTDAGVNGLNEQAAVRFRGLRAGRVTNIDFDPQTPRRILVRLRLSAGIPLTQATRASLGTQGVTGFVFVQLDDDGSNPQAIPPSLDGLPHIELNTRASSPTDAALEAIERIRVVADRLGEVLDTDNRARLSRTLTHLDDSSRHLETLLAKTPELMERMNRFAARLDSDKIDTTLNNLARSSSELPQTLAGLQRASQSIDALGTRWDALGQDLQMGVGSLRIGDTLIELQRTSSEFSKLVEILERNPQAIVFGRPEPRPGPGEGGYRIAPQGQE